MNSKFVIFVRFAAIFMALQFAPLGEIYAGKLAFAPASLDFGGNALGESKALPATL